MPPALPDASSAAPSSAARRFFEHTIDADLLARVAADMPDDVCVAFDLSGTSGGAWQVVTAGGDTRVEPMGPGPKDCVVRCSARDFMEVVRGGLHPRDAFLAGRLRMSGDVGLALRLHGILAEAA